MSDEKCTCQRCGSCDGSGYLRYDTGSNWNDDPNDEKTCEDCCGSGIEAECDYCRDQRDVDSDGVAPS